MKWFRRSDIVAVGKWLERYGSDLKVMQADHSPLALQLLAQGTRDGGGFVIEWHRGMAVEDRFEFDEPGG